MLRLLLCLWLALNFHVSSSSSSTRCRPEDRSALLALSPTFGWNENPDCCEWTGVECDAATGHVAGLSLTDEDLSINGVASNSSLFWLCRLRKLDLYATDYDFKVKYQVKISPAAFGSLTRNLTSLEELELSGFDMSLVPPASLTNLSRSLTWLSISDCLLLGELPDKAFSSFPKLEKLDLFWNNLSGLIPSSIFELKRLRSLELVFNNFSGEIPEFRGNLISSLTTINLARNSLSGLIPSWIFRLPNLERIDLEDNRLTGEIGEFRTTSLGVLSLSGNKLQGHVPRSIFRNTMLGELYLQSNNLTGNVELEDLSKLLGLDELDLSSNYNLSLRFNSSTRNFTLENLFSLSLSSCHITEFPLFIKYSKTLDSLDLSNNQIQGSVPTWLCSYLEVLDLGNNALNDTFPNWLESLPELRVLVLRSNRLHGSIGNPNESRFPFLNLRIMDLSYNEFNGALPNEYFKNFKAMQVGKDRAEMSYMGEFYYQDSVVVTMKGGVFELVKIQTLFTTIDFSVNNFSGKIPDSLGKLGSLKGLNLSHNSISGTLPSSLRNLNSLEWLDLSSNDLIGKIPAELADITSLEFLNLSHNRLVGPIPHSNQFNTFGNESFTGNLDLRRRRQRQQAIDSDSRA